MAFTSTAPVEKDGIIYPYFTVNLAISPNIQETSIGGSVALRLTPYRILEDGTFDFLPEATKALAYGDIFSEIAGGDMALAAAAQAILGGVQAFINNKGL